MSRKVLNEDCELEEKTCKHTAEHNSPHPCPYLGDIHNDMETLCTCCDGCMEICARDV